MHETKVSYNPDIAPDPTAWLALDEDVRLALVSAALRVSDAERHRFGGHAALYVVVENQIALQVPGVVSALQRLRAEGLDRPSALHAIAGALLTHLKEQSAAPTADALARYDAELALLSADQFRDA